ncbi:hybrid sensor histidine kinase/response regulator [Pseudanabaena sp. ABRG5-3]|uniref:ATP-binding response regulator n=1 Tax=Pseudanabaena sp. ABRG5-3 TaxID=685565 RepID=UPI000DC6E5B7|nr:hybrid sensor histidine kinase/response regulator [Pseudanabaena sp. ABRG5-3]BBC26461.1 two-component sensor protein histidine kinase [Pseudanabaena sp. ABRG5-3]
MADNELTIVDDLEFADEMDQVSSPSLGAWKVLIVDDEVEVHNITRLALEDFRFNNKSLNLLSAYSGIEARQIMLENPDIAIALLDVIMESDDAGLITAKYIRETLQNRAIRIILRTGQPGRVPEQQVVVNYDIDDYKTKTELTSQKLFTTLITSLRVYTLLVSLNANLEHANAALIQSSKLKDEFLSTMNHELRTPLNAILGMTECLLGEFFGTINSNQEEALEIIKSSSKDLLKLINDMMDASKIMAGMLKLDITTVAIADLCSSSLKFVKNKALEKQIQLTMNLATQVTAIAVDEQRLRQVLIHLLDNAIKFTPSGGKVSLDVRIENEQNSDPWIQFLVTDTGIGIAPHHQAKIFQAFTQIDSGLNRKYEGSGLGLALVQQLVELHCGYVNFSSNIDQGSCFTVHLPLKAQIYPTQDI